MFKELLMMESMSLDLLLDKNNSALEPAALKLYIYHLIQILSNKLEAEAKKLTGLDQYSYSRYAKAFEIFPRILAENAGVNANDFVPKMVTANES